MQVSKGVGGIFIPIVCTSFNFAVLSEEHGKPIKCKEIFFHEMLARERFVV